MSESNNKTAQSARSFNPTPKAVFLQSGRNISDHRQLVDSDAFCRAENAAIVHYLKALCAMTPDETNPNFIPICAANYQKMVGMTEFLSTFRGMSETPPPAKPRVVDNLEQQ